MVRALSRECEAFTQLDAIEARREFEAIVAGVEPEGVERWAPSTSAPDISSPDELRELIEVIEEEIAGT